MLVLIKNKWVYLWYFTLFGFSAFVLAAISRPSETSVWKKRNLFSWWQKAETKDITDLPMEFCFLWKLLLLQKILLNIVHRIRIFAFFHFPFVDWKSYVLYLLRCIELLSFFSCRNCFSFENSFENSFCFFLFWKQCMNSSLWNVFWNESISSSILNSYHLPLLIFI